MAAVPQTQTEPFKILLYNVGYCTELDGSLRNYFFQFYRYLYTPQRVIAQAMRRLNKMISTQQPDLCCFIEIHKNKRSRPNLHAYSYSDIEHKYGFHSILRKLPYFRNNCNGFFARSPLTYKKYFFKNGTKKLLYDIQLREDTSLLLVHFSLKASTRTKQFQGLKEFMKQKKHVVLCGDFNTFSHVQELETFAKLCKLRIVNKPSEGTFPAKNPKNAIDLFLCSEGVSMGNIRVLHNIKASDHLPVMLELELAKAK